MTLANSMSIEERGNTMSNNDTVIKVSVNSISGDLVSSSNISLSISSENLEFIDSKKIGRSAAINELITLYRHAAEVEYKMLKCSIGHPDYSSRFPDCPRCNDAAMAKVAKEIIQKYQEKCAALYAIISTHIESNGLFEHIKAMKAYTPDDISRLYCNNQALFLDEKIGTRFIRQYLEDLGCTMAENEKTENGDGENGSVE